MAHYTDRLRENLQTLGIPSTVLTTHAAAQSLATPDVIQPRDVDGLAIALMARLDDRAQCHQLSQAGYTFVQTLTWEAIATAHLQIYQSVLPIVK